MNTEHFRLLFLENAPPEKWLALGKYCLQQSGLAPEITELVKAQGPLWHRQVRPPLPMGEAPDPFPHPDVETLWQALLAWGQAWPQTLRTWLTWGAQHGDPAHWQPGWQGLQRRLQWVHDLALNWLLGRRPLRGVELTGTTWQEEWKLLALPQRLLGVFPHAADIGRGVRPPMMVDSWPAVQDHARLTLAPAFSRLEHTVVRTAQEAERQSTLQGKPLLAAPASGQTAALERLEQVTPAWQTEWSRTARTELMDAYAYGAVQALVEHQAEMAFRVPSVRACLDCKRIFLEADGAPKLFLLSELLANGTNEGKKREEWLPVSGPVHVNCVCSPPMQYLPAMEQELFARMRAAHVAAQRPEEAAHAE